MWYARHFRGWTLIAAFAAAVAAGSLTPARAGSAAEPTEHIYADGKTYTINTEAAVDLEAPSGVLAQADPFYIIGFPVPPGTTGPITLPVWLPAPEQRSSCAHAVSRSHRHQCQQPAPTRG